MFLGTCRHCGGNHMKNLINPIDGTHQEIAQIFIEVQIGNMRTL